MAQRVAFFDIAGTLIAGNPWDSVLSHPDIDRRRVRMAYLRILPIWLARKARLIPDALFRHYWILEMARILQGWSEEQTHRLFAWVVEQQMAVHDREPVIARLRQHKEAGEHVVLVSGIFDDMVRAFAQVLDADGGIGSKLVYQGGRCSGKIDGPTIGGKNKLDSIQQYLQDNGFSISLAECYAYADSFSDAPMLSAVGHAVATYPDSALRILAVERAWKILPDGG